MMRIAQTFKQPGHKALIAYVTAGYPTIDATLKAVPLLVQNGCDMIELGIPFSDPLADGVTIQKASYSALKNGVTPGVCLDIARELSRKVDVPLLFMTYYNPVFSYGLEAFCHDCSKSGINGLIIPDLPPDEGSALESMATGEDIDLIYLLSPSSSEERIKLVAKRSRGFIYLVSITGVTGTRSSLPQNLEPFVARVRKVAQQPLCVGFGISTPEQAKQAAQKADGVIIGSRIIQLMESDTSLQATGTFIKELRVALDRPR
jgi:tryptophan synthase alpha chain